MFMGLITSYLKYAPNLVALSTIVSLGFLTEGVHTRTNFFTEIIGISVTLALKYFAGLLNFWYTGTFLILYLGIACTLDITPLFEIKNLEEGI